MEPAYITAHDYSIDHRDEVLASEACGCFYCLAIFTPDKIEHWCDDDRTARCPRCDMDSVIGSKSGYPITTDFLRQMKRHWF